MIVDKEHIHEAIDKLSPQNLEKLSEYIESLTSEEDHEDWFGKVYDLFEPVRAGIEARGMTDDEVNQILDEALDEVRRERKA